jgi:hypothetical protein
MKALKMLGLIAIATIAATAFLGAGSASATVLCTVVEPECSEENQYPTGTEFKFSSSDFKLGFFSEGSFQPEPVCNSNMTLKTTAAEGTPLPVSLIGFSISSCETGCVVKAEGLPRTGGFEWTGAGETESDGTLSLTLPRLAITCGTFPYYYVKCEYAPAEAEFEVQSGEQPHLALSEVPLTPSPEEGWKTCEGNPRIVSATYSMYSPEGGLYLERE